mmetsp:Transcript_27206/g.40404  ORF Transcript_27206/g.40404 Transcript_27206/m.40404 type:complete len:347 (-) Transcript_27206:40-1080(-)
MLMRSILGNMLFNHATPCTWNISGINDVQYNIGTINHFEEFSPDTFGLSLEEKIVFFLYAVIHSFSFRGCNVRVASPWYNAYAGVDLFVRFIGFLRSGEERRVTGCIVLRSFGQGLCHSSHRRNVIERFLLFSLRLLGCVLICAADEELIELDALPSAFGPKGVLKGFRGQQPRTEGSNAAIGSERCSVLEQTHGELLALEHDRVRIRHLIAHLLAELVQVRSAHNARVAEPASVRCDPTRGAGDLCVARSIFHHELSAHHGALLVPNGLAVVVHFETLDGIAVSHVAVVLFGGLASGFGGRVGTLQHVHLALIPRLLRVFPSCFRHRIIPLTSSFFSSLILSLCF